MRIHLPTWLARLLLVAALGSMGIVEWSLPAEAVAEATESTFCDSIGEIPNEECHALVTLYQSSDGPNWVSNSGWLDTTTPCSWHGVTCSDGHVTGIDLRANRLNGTLPAELSNLADLLVLNLEYNQLGGIIPSQLGNLAYLQFLNLQFNQLWGSIPPHLGNLSSLQKLNLRYNQLGGSIPAELGNLTSLQYLDLGYNQLDGNIPSELGNLANLGELYLRGNLLGGSIPAELGNLTNASSLNLSSNQLEGGIPPSLGNLAKLEHLLLSGNLLSGSIPPETGNLSNLRSLYLSQNQLRGSIPPELGRLDKLLWLFLFENRLSGSIPPELGNSVSLISLILNDNELVGNIPVELGGLTNLRRLRLSNNHLGGPIPSELGNLANLVDLQLDRNQLNDSIPSELGDLTGLTWLTLDSNALEGEIPSTIVRLVNLSQTNLAYNKLTASNPVTIDFLAEKDPDWALTQTVPPADVHVVEVSEDAVVLGWTPIAYQAHGGFYEVSFAVIPDGPITVHGVTENKYGASYAVDSLMRGTEYEFVVRTFTPAHYANQNDLLSWYSEKVTVATPPQNMPPIANAGGPYVANEGEIVLLDASGSYDPDDDALRYEWDLDQDGEYDDAEGIGVEIEFEDDGLFAVGLRVVDELDTSDTDSVTITIVNVAPAIEVILAPSEPVSIGSQPVSVEVNFSDPGQADIHDVRWQWGDGSIDTQVHAASPTWEEHSYVEAGVYAVEVVVTDDDGGVGAGRYEFVVIYDADGAFVTGGGWIWSEAGCCQLDDACANAEGKATFGFVSKYNHGADTPGGNTEFVFQAADLNFHSTSYDWLVVAGTKAMFKGTGTVNGEGSYKFMLTAIDAVLNDNDSFTIDRFRIKIWEEDELGTETIIYDSGLGAADDDANATTEIGGGLIMIHTKSK